MKVAITFPGCHRRAGVERVVYECARYLASTDNQVTVLASEWDEIPHPRVKMVRIQNGPMPSFLQGIGFLRKCTKALRNISFDVLNTHGCTCPFEGVHWVQSVHAAWLERAKQFRLLGSWSWWRQHLNPAHRILLCQERAHFRGRRFRHLIATTSAVKSDLTRLYGVPQNDITVIPNGFSPTEFNAARRMQNRSAARSALSLDQDETVFLFAANELARKGYTTLLKAIVCLPDQNFKLLAVGRFSQKEAVKLAIEMGVVSRIIFHSSTDDISWYHAASDALVLPTQYEAFCLTILEALGSGLPVITTDVPGARDVVRDGVNGKLIGNPDNVDGLAEAMASLCNKRITQEMSQETSSSVAGYKWPSLLNQYESILQQHSNAKGLDV